MEQVEITDVKKEPNYRGVKVMPFVIGNETFEKLGTIGTSLNLIVYLTTIFNMKSITATNVINIFNATCNFGTLIGAFLSDTYLGRYKTLGIASVSSFLGMLALTMTAALPTLHPPTCTATATSCTGASPGQLAFLYGGFTLLVIGAGGIRTCNLAFGADQFNPNTESGKRGINSFFNWYYFTFTFAMMVSLTIVVYVQSNVSWSIGLGIPTIMMFFSCAFFFIGTRLYVVVLPEGSPLTSIVQTMVVAFRNRKLELPEEPWNALFNHVAKDSINLKLEYTDQLRCLNKAAIRRSVDVINADGSAANPWRLRSLQQVEEIKCIIRLIPIWLAGIIYYIFISVSSTYPVFQAIQSDRHLGKFQIPAASYGVFNMISLTIWIPIYDRICVPLLRRITGTESGITILQRMGVGVVLAILTMLTSAVVETHRRDVALTRPTAGFAAHNGAISAMSTNWLIPQMVLGGLSEAFFIIGQIELFYKQFPENMKSFAGSFAFCGFALAGYLASLLITIVNKTTRVGRSGSSWLADDLNEGRLDYFYYLVTAMEVVNLGYFLFCAHKYVYKKRDESSTSKVVGLEKEIDTQKQVV